MENFKPVKFIGSGHYSMVYEVVVSNGKRDRKESFALKRFFITNFKAADAALREHHVLKRLAIEGSKSPFITTLLYSFLYHDSPVLVLSKGSGIDLLDIIDNFSPLTIDNAIFYLSEIISGLVNIHSKQIVHLDLKPENILISYSGHAIVSDFDCAYDMAFNEGPPKGQDYRGTFYYMAPEIANKVGILYETDTWGVGALMACMISGRYRPKLREGDSTRKQAEEGSWEVRGYDNLSRPLQDFFGLCFHMNPHQRVLPANMKCLEIFRNINWQTDVLHQRPPPYQPSQIVRRSDQSIPMDPCCQDILETLTWKEKPLMVDGKLETIPMNSECIRMSGITSKLIRELFANFDFTNESGLDCEDVC